MMPPWAAVAAHALAPTLFCKTLQDERQILRRSIYPSTGLRLQCNIWRGARLYRRTQTAHADVEKITKISRESYKRGKSPGTQVQHTLGIGTDGTEFRQFLASTAERYGRSPNPPGLLPLLHSS